ncbi:MAG: hypothetical protein LBC59_09925 [Chitinispirillales bacterium]|jgi:hypothetical protein|nr:hypothetical protein [Chitinispirillales bacterium]
MTIKRTVATIALTLTFALAAPLFAQSVDAYDLGGSYSSRGDSSTGLFDPSRLKVSHAMSFMAGGSSVADVRSQSLYSTMIQYKFNAPVVMSLNFNMPIHSTFNRYNNFTTDNLSSLDYFRNMPIDASIAWMPTQNLMFRVSVIKQPESGYFYNSLYAPDRWHYRGW